MFIHSIKQRGFGLILIFSLFSCSTTIPNYMLPNEPLWKDNSLVKNHAPKNSLKVVSFNQKKVIAHYKAFDFDWITEKVGATGSEVNGWLKPTNDHIFTDGFTLIDAGKYEQTEASDHYPIWVEMTFEE